MTQPLPGKTRCSTGPSANAIISRAKYTRRFMLLMAMLIGQIECYKFQQQTDDLPRTLITADRCWNVFWGEQTLGLGSVFRPVLSSWDNVTLLKWGTLAVVKKRAVASEGQRRDLTASCWWLTFKAAPQQPTSKQQQLLGLMIPSQYISMSLRNFYYEQNKHDSQNFLKLHSTPNKLWLVWLNMCNNLAWKEN